MIISGTPLHFNGEDMKGEKLHSVTLALAVFSLVPYSLAGLLIFILASVDATPIMELKYRFIGLVVPAYLISIIVIEVRSRPRPKIHALALILTVLVFICAITIERFMAEWGILAWPMLIILLLFAAHSGFETYRAYYGEAKKDNGT